MPILLEHARDDNQRVTAGIPGLSPSSRREITEYYLRQVYQRALQAEYRGNEEAATSDDGAINVTKWEEVVGMPLTGFRIMSRLKKLNPGLWFEASKADESKLGIYVFNGLGEKEFLVGIEKEINPEFTLRVTDDKGKPKGIIPGWRRAIMRLIRSKMITEAAVFRVFGPPSRDSENWARFTQ